MHQFCFTKLLKAEQQRVHEWLKKPHVQQYYYGLGLQNTLKNIALFVNGTDHNGNYRFAHWLALYDNEPIGFLMTSPIEGPYDPNDPYNKWYTENQKITTLDLLIGEEKFLGKGLATPMIQAFLLDKCKKYNRILIDPAQENTKATHVYEKAGFKKVEAFTPEYDPIPHWMMTLQMQDLIKKYA